MSSVYLDELRNVGPTDEPSLVVTAETGPYGGFVMTVDPLAAPALGTPPTHLRYVGQQVENPVGCGSNFDRRFAVHVGTGASERAVSAIALTATRGVMIAPRTTPRMAL